MQFQLEVNDIRAERIAKSANPLALIAAAQPYSDNYYQAPKPQRSNATSSSTRPSASTRHKGKEIAKPITPQSESVSVSDEDSDPEQAQRDMQKNLALLAKYFKKLYKPTNNNLRIFSKTRNKTEDTTPRYNNYNQSGQFGNQRTMIVAGARKPKRVKDYAYHKEKMMMCKQAEQGVPLQAEQADWLEDTDEEIDEQELEAHYSYMAKIQDVSPEGTSSTGQPLEQVQNHDESNVYDNVRRHSEQPESINDTYVLEKDDSNVIPDSSNICTNDNQVDQNAAECVDERAALANLIANLTLDTEENKTILKQLKKANASLTQELEKCKTNLDETNSALGEAISCRDSCLIALQNKQNEFEKYKAFNDRTIDYEILQTKLNETLGLLALKDIDIKEGLKTKTYEISVVNQKHDELVKKSLLTRSQFEGQLKEKSKVISDLKVKEGKDIDTMIEMDKQIKFLNEILYKRNQSIQTIHMLAPKCATYNGRSTFANPKYLKKAQSDKPRLYEIPYDTSDPANRFCPDGEETVTLEKESRSKLDKDKVKPYNYTYQNSLYETFKPPSKAYLDQLERAKEVRKTMWRKTFVRTKPNIAKNVGFLPMSKSISKSRLLYNEMTNNFNHFRTICQQTWSNHTSSAFPNPTAKSMEVLIKILLMPLSDKTILDSHCFIHELKKEMNDDKKSTCFVRDLQGNDLLTGNRGSDLYTISLQETTSSTPICFMAKASPTQACSKGRQNLLHMDLCGPMRVASINGKKYILVIVDDYSRYTWTLFLRSKDETPEFLNKTLHAYFKEEGIEHQTSTPRTPEQNGVVERRNRTLVEAARTMLSASKLPLSFGLKRLHNRHANTQKRSISNRLIERTRRITPTLHQRTANTQCAKLNTTINTYKIGEYEVYVINDRKPSIKASSTYLFAFVTITRRWEEFR
ncbi:retrovirus-related pol polyprotein from transposon TNT 1-94 [Tanacetum coccineum]